MSSRAPVVEWDVAVVGGGPAGSASALSAAGMGLSVLLFEPQVGAMDKPCGEGLMPEGVRVLDELGLAGLRRQARAFDTLAIHVADRRPLLVPLPGAGLAIPRPTLVGGLRAALSAQSRLRTVAAAVRLESSCPPFVLRAGDASWRARTLIVAEGLGGRCAPWLRGARRVTSRGRAGVRARFACARPMLGVEVYLGPRSEVYLTPLPGDQVNVAALFERPPRAVGADAWLAAALEDHPRVAAGLGASTTPPAARVLSHSLPRRTSDGDAFLVGDAGGGVDPILGCGLALALASGAAAARAADERLAGAPAALVARRYERVYARLTRSRRAIAGLLRIAARHERLGVALGACLGRAPWAVRRLARSAAGEA